MSYWVMCYALKPKSQRWKNSKKTSQKISCWQRFEYTDCTPELVTFSMESARWDFVWQPV